MTKTKLPSLTRHLITATLTALALHLPMAHAGYDEGGVAYEKKNYVAAVVEFRKGAIQGEAKSQYALGVMYGSGQGVAKDERKAGEWYRKAAEQGYADAQNNLGVCFRNGDCQPKNLIAAYGLYSIAAANGNELGKKNLAGLESMLTREDIAKGQQLGSRMFESKKPMAVLDSYVKANPWREPKVAAPAQRPAPRPQASSGGGKSVTCSNQCYNGNCVRTFPNGQTERWQAPRKFNVFNNNWEWDTTTNACGL